MRRDLFTDDHEAFRELVRDFVEKEVVPTYPDWEKVGRMPRETFKRLGSLGLLGMAIPEEYGGGGTPDYRYNVILQEEASRKYVTFSTVRTQLDVILPYFLNCANDEQRRRWFPGLADGSLLTAVAMTEPGTGSDLAGMRATAVHDGGPIRRGSTLAARGRRTCGAGPCTSSASARTGWPASGPTRQASGQLTVRIQA